MEPTPLRVYLLGRICAESGSQVSDDSWFSSRQARLLFAYLVCEHTRPVPREELAEVLWPAQLPPAWDSALRSLISKLRHFLDRLGHYVVPPSISSQFGCYQLHLPPHTWIDLEAARHSIDEAEGAIRSGDVGAAWGPVNVALVIARRPFLAGEDGSWVDVKRRELQDLLLRALDCYTEICLKTHQNALAVQMAKEVISLEPFRERGHAQLMHAYAALGNRAEALQVYHQCRALLGRELGIDPSPATEALYLELLRLPSATT